MAVISSWTCLGVIVLGFCGWVVVVEVGWGWVFLSVEGFWMSLFRFM